MAEGSAADQPFGRMRIRISDHLAPVRTCQSPIGRYLRDVQPTRGQAFGPMLLLSDQPEMRRVQSRVLSVTANVAAPWKKGLARKRLQDPPHRRWAGSGHFRRGP